MEVPYLSMTFLLRLVSPTSTVTTLAYSPTSTALQEGKLLPDQFDLLFLFELDWSKAETNNHHHHHLSWSASISSPSATAITSSMLNSISPITPIVVPVSVFRRDLGDSLSCKAECCFSLFAPRDLFLLFRLLLLVQFTIRSNTLIRFFFVFPAAADWVLVFDLEPRLTVSDFYKHSISMSLHAV